MKVGQKYCFLCIDKMADSMDRVVALAGGEIFLRDDRSYGVVICVRKKEGKRRTVG
jgi:hypothetical protein